MGSEGSRPESRFGRWKSGGLSAFLATSLAVGGAGAAAEPQRHEDALAKARSLIAGGDSVAAASIYEELLRVDPRNPTLLTNLTVARFKAGQFQETIALCRRILDSSPQIAPAHLFLGASHYQLGEYEAAIPPLREFLKMRPRERNARLMLAEALLLLDQHDEALTHFLSVSAQLESDPRIWYGLNRASHHLARAAATRIERDFADSPEAHVVVGLAHRDLGSFATAESNLRLALNRREQLEAPAVELAARALSEVYRKSGREDLAEEPELMIGGDQTCAGASPACQFVRGEFAELTQAEAADSDVRSLFWKSQAYDALETKALRRLADLPESPQLHEIRARALNERGAHGLATREWKRARDLDPTNRTLSVGLANSLYESQDYGGAVALLDELLASGDSAELLFLRGSARLSLQLIDPSIQDLKRALELRPDLDQAKAELSRAYMQSGEPSRAVPLLVSILHADTDGSFHYRLAQAYSRMGDRESELQVLTDYARFQPGSKARKAEGTGRPTTATQ